MDGQPFMPPGTVTQWVRELKAKYIEMWYENCGMPELGPVRTAGEKRQFELDIDAMIRRITADFEAMPVKRAEGISGALQESVNCIGRHVPGLVPEDMDTGLSGAFLKSADDLLLQGGEMVPGASATDFIQALRNMWVFNALQAYLGEDVTLTPSILGYSMLYPCTDNYLDSPEVPDEEKQGFSVRFRNRLEGGRPLATNPLETVVYSLVGSIESQYDRTRLPAVFDSLLAIHDAQRRALRQQGRCIPGEVDIIGISVEKGGTSVLADGLLVRGFLDRDDADFIFGLGVLLQFIDDMQDLKEDIRRNHMTAFSLAALTGKPLDALAGQVFAFMAAFLDGGVRNPIRRRAAIVRAVQRSCSYLAIEAVARNRAHYSRRFCENLESHCPVRFKYLRHLAKRLARDFSDAAMVSAVMPIKAAVGLGTAQMTQISAQAQGAPARRRLSN